MFIAMVNTQYYSQVCEQRFALPFIAYSRTKQEVAYLRVYLCEPSLSRAYWKRLKLRWTTLFILWSRYGRLLCPRKSNWREFTSLKYYTGRDTDKVNDALDHRIGRAWHAFPNTVIGFGVRLYNKIEYLNGITKVVLNQTVIYWVTAQ